ncbi:MAG: hypothetical protein ABL962_17065 [Fimbriimonadaceae bacterium]
MVTLRTNSAVREVDDSIYLYAETMNSGMQWFLGTRQNVLGGPFVRYDDLLTWAIEKEFVEPKRHR